MPQPTPLKKHTLHLREGDFEFLADYFASTTQSPSGVIRQVVSVYVDKLQEKQAASAPKIEIDP